MFSTGVYIGVVRLALAAVFLFSGLAKLFSPQPAAAFVADVLSLSSDTSLVLILILSVVELAIGLSLAMGYRLQLVSFLASFFLFCALLVGLFYFEEDKSCGCFGDFVASKTDIWFLIRNVSLILLSLLLLRHSSSTTSQQAEIRHD
jgi:uncharacterized membrane protein YphA (DoxX/SURF4 family)